MKEKEKEKEKEMEKMKKVGPFLFARLFARKV